MIFTMFLWRRGDMLVVEGRITYNDINEGNQTIQRLASRMCRNIHG
jgi:hypothetical protein